MNTMNGRGMMKPGQQQAMGQHDGLPYEEMGYGGMPPPNRKLPPVPNQHSNYNTIDRIKNGEYFELVQIDANFSAIFGYWLPCSKCN